MSEPDPSTSTLIPSARGTAEQAEAFFHVLAERTIESTRTSYRVHWLRSDPHGRDRTTALATHLYNRITDYCTPRSRIREARIKDDADGGTTNIMALQEEARRLFLDSTTSGEGGELLLFFLLETHLRIPQILCKMPLKTSQQMPIHGVDGVHAQETPGGGLAVYWGESKLYEDVQSALTSCFDSIAPFLLDDGSGVAHRDLVLVRENLDTGDHATALRLVQFFTDDSPSRNQLEVRGACLVGFTHDEFAEPFDPELRTLLQAVEQRIESWSSSVRTRVTTRKLESFEMEFFCLPLPSVKRLRQAFSELVGR